MDAAIHTNPYLKHQVAWAKALAAGFKRHGLEAVITSEQGLAAPIHVVQGPYYALSHWQHRDILYLDRCFYGSIHEYCSLGWRYPSGRRDYRNANSPAGRWHGRVAPWKTGQDRALVIADYGDNGSALFNQARAVFPETRLRLHPDAEPPKESLAKALKWADVVIGTSSTALVQAILQGVPVICYDDNHVVAPVSSSTLAEPLYRGPREQWCKNLAYTQWHREELAAGDFWPHLRL